MHLIWQGRLLSVGGMLCKSGIKVVRPILTLTSRWTRPRSCMYSRALSTSFMTVATDCQSSRPCTWALVSDARYMCLLPNTQ